MHGKFSRLRVGTAGMTAVAVLTLAACGSSSSPAATAANTSTAPSSSTGSSATAAPASGATSSAAVSTSAATGGSAKGGTIYNVVKLAGGGWFNRMETGNKKWVSMNAGFTVEQKSGSDSSPEKQIAVLSNLIPQKPVAISVVPNDPQSLQAVLKRAHDAGIVIVSQEAAGMKNTDADIEAFQGADYGAHQMDLLAKCIGSAGGQYAQFVGALTVTSHMDWAAGALAQAKAHYPSITRIGDPISSNESEDTAYEQTKQLLAKYPNIKGILGAASTDVAGAGRAVAEAGKSGSICVVGTSLPSISGALLKTGAVDEITFWDPALAGEAMLNAAKMLLGGQKIVTGSNLGVAGYSNMTQDQSSTTYYGNAWVDVTSANAAQYPF
jgi:simple sugar transport system substrate-binding protein